MKTLTKNNVKLVKHVRNSVIVNIKGETNNIFCSQRKWYEIQKSKGDIPYDIKDVVYNNKSYKWLMTLGS